MSSLPYQLLLYFEAWYFGLFVLFELLIFVYKGVYLPYPRGYLAAEIILLLFLTAVETVRNFFGQKGNLTGSGVNTAASLILTVPNVLATVYYLVWQIYVLRIEIILTATQLGFYAFQIIFAILSLVTSFRSSAT